MQEYWISVACFLAMFAALFFAGVQIYHKLRWDACKFYFLAVVILACLPCMDHYGFSEIYNGYEFAYGVFVLAIISVWTWRCFVVWGNQDEFDRYINEKIDELGEPSDSELIRIKGKFQYDKNSPRFSMVENDLQRSFLTSEWRKRKYNKFQFEYGFDWIAIHRQEMKDHPPDEDEEYYDDDQEDI